MRRTIPEQIAANNRLSLFYSFLVVVVLAMLGAALGGYYVGGLEGLVLGSVALAVVGIIVALVAWFSGSKIVLRIAQARKATQHELRVLENVTEEMALAAGIPKPEFYIIDDSVPNAFATGRRPEEGIVVVTQGLMNMLNREELQAVVAHEVAHIRNNDIRFMTTLSLVVGIIPLISEFFLRTFWFTGSSRSRSSSGGGGGALVMLVIALVMAVLAPIFAKLLELAVSRQREYMADASAVQFTRNPDGLASALNKLSRPNKRLEVANHAMEHMYIVNPFKPLQAANSLFSTHPPLKARIQRLQTMGARFGTDDEYNPYAPLPEAQEKPPRLSN